MLQRVLHWLGGRLDWLFGGSPAGSATLVLVVLLAAGILLTTLRAAPVRRTARASPSRSDDPLHPTAGVDHRVLAEQFAADGRLAESVREFLRAAVRTIEDRGVLDARPGRTGAEIARSAGELLPQASRALHDATGAFDRIWFGSRAATHADVSVARDAADQVRTATLVVPDVSTTGYAVPR